jgi:hypothetical protein
VRLQARFQVRHTLLERSDLLQRGVKLKLLILHDLHERSHHGLDARRCARPIGVGDSQSLRQVIHRRKSASDSLGCQLTRIGRGRERLR